MVDWNASRIAESWVVATAGGYGSPIARLPARFDQSGGTDTMTVQEMLRTHPSPTAGTETLARCIEECFVCAQSCTACADACLGERDVAELTRCIRLNLDCADVCETTGKILSRQTQVQTELMRAIVQACVEACRDCGEECESHAEHHDHCRVCADACRRCEQACDDALIAFGR
jgi:hypothetical protein